MSYVITIEKSILETWQATVDIALNYPEPLESLRNVGLGVHAPIELGRALHFADIITDQTGTKYALPVPEEIDPPSGVQFVTELPSDWYEELS